VIVRATGAPAIENSDRVSATAARRINGARSDLPVYQRSKRRRSR
jgi:hypothetical protein